MSKTWRYSIPNEKYQGWAILFLDDAGCFAVLSDYGNYSYRWNARGFGGDRDIREFVINCDNGYLIGKLCPKQEYDGEKTLKVVKEHILEQRRDGSWDAERAREEWDLLRYNSLDNEYDFVRWMDNTKIDDAYEMARHVSDHHAVAFLERAWPRLKALIQAELKAEDEANAQVAVARAE